MKKTQGDALYELFRDSSYLDGNSAGYVEALYEDYLSDPDAVPHAWKSYFDSLASVNGDVSHANIRKTFKLMAQKNVSSAGPVATDKQHAVDALISAYRQKGHRAADINPLLPASHDLSLGLSTHDLSSQDEDTVFLTRGW